MQVHDAVIVGAGPGGSATAHFLSDAGLDVLLVDRAEFPRDKTCGDGLTPRALRVLERMGILEDVIRHGCRVDGYEVVAPNGHATQAAITGPHSALVVPRVTLDQIILDRAIRSGAQFRARTTVSHLEPLTDGVAVHTEKGEVVRGRVAIVATGAATSVLKRSNILRNPTRPMLAARAYFEDLERDVGRAFQLRFDGVPLPGYGWVFPVASGVANVGVGFLPRRHAKTATQAYHSFVTGETLRETLRGGRQAGPVKGYPIRVDFLRAPTSADRTLLVGEAAGLVNPLTGEGIDYALESGAIAAEHVVRGLAAGTDQTWRTQYDQELHERFDRVFRFSEWIRDWYCKPLLLNFLVPLANRRPELRQLLASIVLGEREPRGYGPVTMGARLALYLARHH